MRMWVFALVQLGVAKVHIAENAAIAPVYEALFALHCWKSHNLLLVHTKGCCVAYISSLDGSIWLSATTR